jgi:hypothetical protein
LTHHGESVASADNINAGLQDAFADANTQGVILRINSPGGSPVQAHAINGEIRRLRAKYPAIPLYAVVDDICASGGYYVAVAADKIYVSKGSLVGSIGVLMDGFGFTGTMEKLGVERRNALLLRVDEELGYDEIAARMGWSLAKVKNEIHRARVDLRALVAASGAADVHAVMAGGDACAWEAQVRPIAWEDVASTWVEG